MTIESPRKDTFTPNSRDSSSRLASLTPASVSMSAPSVETFCVMLSPATADPRSVTIGAPLIHCDVQFPEVLVGNRAGCPLEERARRRGFGICNHVAQRRRSGQDHGNAIEAKGDAPVWRCTRPQTLEQKSESRLCGCLIDTQKGKHLGL